MVLCISRHDEECGYVPYHRFQLQDDRTMDPSFKITDTVAGYVTRVWGGRWADIPADTPASKTTAPMRDLFPEKMFEENEEEDEDEGLDGPSIVFNQAPRVTDSDEED